MRSLDVVFAHNELRPERVEKRAVAVIDVLRAGTTIAEAFSVGATEIRLFDDVDVAAEARNTFKGNAALGGERAGVKIRGFDLGNSPGEYTKSTVGGRTLFFTTTNGTAALLKCESSPFCTMAALVNAAAVAKALASRKESILIVCAGTEGNYAAEDALCAGIIASRLLVEVDPGMLSLGDGARIAIAYAAEGASQPREALTNSSHGKILASLGLRRDLALCSVIDSLSIVPVLKRDPLRLIREA